MGYYHFNPPVREEYDTDEDYQDALKMWEWAQEGYEEECHERRKGL